MRDIVIYDELSSSYDESFYRVTDFLIELRSFMSYCNLDNWSSDRRSSLDKEIDLLESTYYAMCIIFKRFQEAFGLLFNFDFRQETTIGSSSAAYDFYRFAWCLFLLLKGNL
jgi:hypothetical protein